MRLVGLYHSPKLVCEIHILAPAGQVFSTATGPFFGLCTPPGS